MFEICNKMMRPAVLTYLTTVAFEVAAIAQLGVTLMTHQLYSYVMLL